MLQMRLQIWNYQVWSFANQFPDDMMDVDDWFIAYTAPQLYYMLTNTCG